MILSAISEYVENAGRIEEQQLLKHFHLSREGLSPMMAVLLKRAKIQKTLNKRGETLPAKIYYSWSEKQQIPMMTVV